MDQLCYLTDLMTAVLGQTPQWIRADFSSRDAAFRARAEDALAAILANSIADAVRLSIADPVAVATNAKDRSE
jgi:hypothetical protein